MTPFLLSTQHNMKTNYRNINNINTLINNTSSRLKKVMINVRGQLNSGYVVSGQEHA